MLAIIVGSNRVEVCTLKKKDYEKQFFQHRGQTYLIMPQNLVRMRYVDESGHEIREPDEVIVFAEGSSLPYDTRDECVMAYWQDNVLAAIDIDKAVGRAKAKGQGILATVTRTVNALYPIAGLLITAAIVGYALLTGGT